MITTLLAASLLTAAIIPPATVQQDDCSEAGFGIRMTISGLRDQRGIVRMELYPATKEDFLKKGDALLRAGKLYRSVAVVVSGDVASLCLPVPGPGRYAAVAVHKRRGTSGFDILNDGVAVSGGDRIGRRKPSLDEATVVVTDTITNVDAQMQYLRGFAGFGPLRE